MIMSKIIKKSAGSPSPKTYRKSRFIALPKVKAPSVKKEYVFGDYVSEDEYSAHPYAAMYEAAYFAEVVKYHMMRRIVRKDGPSFARVAKKNSRPMPAVVEVCDRETCRDMYRIFRDRALQAEQEGRELAEAIALRYAQERAAKRAWTPEQIREARKQRQLLREARHKARNFYTRHNYVREVDSFPRGCYEYTPIIEESEPLLRDEEGKVFVDALGPRLDVRQVFKPRPKHIQDKVDFAAMKAAKRDLVHNSRAKTVEGKSESRSSRFAKIIAALHRTKLAIDLAAGLLRSHFLLKGVDLKQFLNPITPEMENEGPVSDEPVKITAKSNVAFEQNSENLDSGNSLTTKVGYKDQSVSRLNQVYKTLGDRWIYVNTYIWQSTHAVNSVVTPSSLKFPQLFFSKGFDDVPALQLLFSHRYFHSDLEFKIVLNSSPFHTGQCIVSWLYGDGTKQDLKHYRNLYSASQRLHAYMNAGSGNDVELTVPYAYHNAVMNTADKPVMGELEVRVLNPLLASANVAHSCSFSLYVSFKNSEYFGQISRRLNVLATPEMDTVADLCDLGSTVIRSLHKDSNRDKPPLPLQPTCLVPTAMASFAYTDHIAEPIHVLRSDPRGQRPQYGSVDEMDVMAMARKPGFLLTEEWSPSSQVVGGCLVAPLASPEKYGEVSTGTFRSRGYPPIAVVSSLFGYWRGSIKYTFKITATKYHKGRLMVGFIPRHTDLTSVTRNVLRNSTHKIVDIEGSTEFEFLVPYYYDNPWVPVRNPGSSDFESTGCIALFVLNPLVAIDSVVNKIFINVYVSAGDDFELAIPRVAGLFPPFISSLKPPANEYLSPYNTEAKMFTTYSTSAEMGSGAYCVVPYIQNISKGWTGFLNAKLNEVYELSTSDPQGRNYQLRYYASATQWLEVKWLVYDPALSTANAHGLVVCPTKDYAERLARGFAAAKSSTEYPALRKAYAVRWVQDSDWSVVFENGNWRTSNNDTDMQPYFFITKLKQSVQLPEMDNNPIDSAKLSIHQEIPAQITHQGLDTFGEQTPDFKSLGRRWIHYGSVAGTVMPEKHPRDMCYFAKLPIHPFRRLDIETSRSYDNRVREGMISTIASGFAFYEGGLRFRLIVSGAPANGSFLYVSHRYDEVCDFTTKPIIYGDKVRSVNDLLTTQYATHAQALSVNTTTTVEVPYYQPNERLWLIPSSRVPYANGALYVYIHSPVKQDVTVEIYYSLADDTRFSVFQGFPAMNALCDIVDEPKAVYSDIVPEMDNENIDSDDDSDYVCHKTRKTDPHEVIIEVNAEPEGANVSHHVVKDIITNNQTTTSDTSYLKKKYDDLINSLSSKMTALKDLLKNPVTYVTNFLKDNVISGITSNIPLILEILTHIVYILLSPTRSVVCFALANIIFRCFDFPKDLLLKMRDGLTKMWSYMRVPAQHSTGPSATEPEVDESESYIGEIGSCIFMGLSSICSIKAHPPKNWSDVSKQMSNFGTASRNSLGIAKFIEFNCNLVKAIFKKFISLFSSGSLDYSLLTGIKDERLQNWVAEAVAMTDVVISEEVLVNPSFSSKIFELTIVGKGIIMALSSAEASSNLVYTRQIVLSLVDKLSKIEKKLLDQKIFCGVRYEPYVLWLYGKAGTMKSTVSNKAAEWFAESMGSVSVHTAYPRTAGNKYFDGYKGQDTIIIDDFMTDTKTVDPESYTQFLQMKSSVLFNPPYAIAEEKDKIINFKNLIITSNQSGINNMPGVLDEEAYNRRRDLLLKFEFVDEKDTSTAVKSRLSIDQIATMDHIKVTELDPLTSKSIREIPKVGSTLESLKLTIMASFKEYHRKQTVLYSQAVSVVMERLAKIPHTNNLDSYLQQVKSALNPTKEKSWLVSVEKWLNIKKQKAGEVVVSTPEMDSDDDIPAFDINFLDITASGTDHLTEKYKCKHLDFYNNHHWGVSLREGRFAVFNEGQFYYSPLLNQPCQGRCICRLDDPASWKIMARCIYKATRTGPHSTIMSSGMSIDSIRDTMGLDIQFRPVLDIVVGYMTQREPTPLRAQKSSPYSNFPKVVKEEQSILSRIWRRIAGLWFHIEKPLFGIGRAIWSLLIDALHVVYNVVVGILSFLLALFVTRKILSLFMSPPNPELHASGDFKTATHKSDVKVKALSMITSEGVLTPDKAKILCQDNFDATTDGIIRKIRANTFFMVGKTEDNASIKARCLGISGRRFIMIKHYLEEFEGRGVKDVVIVFSGERGTLSVPLKDIRFSWTISGYGEGELPAYSPILFKKIINLLPSEKYSRGYPTEMFILEIHNNSYSCVQVRANQLRNPAYVSGRGYMKPWKIPQGFEYNFGKRGLCGSVLFAPSLQSPIVGIHVAGDNNQYGLSELLLRESFTENSIEDYIEYIVPEIEDRPKTELQGEYYIHDRVARSLQVHLPNRTQIVPSVIQGVFPVNTEPAPLSKYDERIEGFDPLDMGVMKRCNRIKVFNPSIISKAVNNLFEMLKFKVIPTRTPSKLSIKEAIEGFRLEGYDSLEFSTSEGYPFSLCRPNGENSKRWMFQLDQYEDGRVKVLSISNDLHQVLLVKDSMRARGVVPVSVFTCCLKDSRILKEKVPVPGKTRLFEMSPIELTIAQRQLFMDFNVAYSTARLNAENTIGINPVGPEWSDMANKLKQFSPYILTADYSGYGPTLDHTLLERVFIMMAGWYDFNGDSGEDEFLSRVVLGHEVIHGVHLIKDLMFRPTCGLPSGNASTVILNSLVNSLYIRIAFLAIMQEHRPWLADLIYFKMYVLLYHNGDDLIMAVKEDIIDIFNNKTLIEFFAQHGLKMTDALKSGTVREFCSLEEATYLKRGFKPHPTRPFDWMAPLETASIEDTANWIRKSFTPSEDSMQNSEQCARLAYANGPEYYNYIVSKLKKAWVKLDKQFVAPSWESLDVAVWEGVQGPLFQFI